MIECLVPGTVATAETREDLLEIRLFDDEERSLGRAVEKRRREFVTGRACARQALKQLGLPATAIPSGGHGEPLWPAGIVGSITHCAGYRACAVARTQDVSSVGIDAEVNAPLPDGVLEQIAFGRERELPSNEGPLRIDRLLFSAKEAVYKAWFPLTSQWLGFEEVELYLEQSTRKFRAELLRPGPIVAGRVLTQFSGAWCVQDGVICSAVVVPSVDQWPAD